MAIKLLSGATAANGVPADVQASITITAVAGASLVDGETFTIMREDGIVFIFEFDSNASVTSTDIRRRVIFAGGDTATQVGDAIVTAVNATPGLNLVASNSAGTVTVKRRVPGPQGNGGSNTEQVANGSFAITAAFASGALAGFALKGDVKGGPFSNGWRGFDEAVIQVQSTAGSGTMTVTLRLWCRSPYTLRWGPMGSQDDPESLRGVLHGGLAIEEDGADNLVQFEPVVGLSAFDRVYLEVVAIGGASTAVDAYLAELGATS